MSLFLIFSGFAVSIDAFFVGMAIGVKRTKLYYYEALFIGILPFILSFFAALAGNLSQSFVGENTAGFISAALLFGFCAYIIFSNDPKKDELPKGHRLITFIPASIAVALDAASISFSMGLCGESPICISLFVLLFHSLLSLLGNRAAILFGKKITGKSEKLLAGLLYFALGVSRLF